MKGVLLDCVAEICKEVGLPLVEDSMQYSDRVCNPCGRNIHNLNWASFTSSSKLQLHPRQVPRLRPANILLTRRTKPDQHGENQNPSVSIREQQSHPRSKVPHLLLTKGKSRKSLSFSLLEKIKNLKALLSLILTSKEVRENAYTNKTN